MRQLGITDFFASQAKKYGISNSAIVNLVNRGRLERLAHGVYRIDNFVPHPDGLDSYACAVACCGEDAYLWGPSAMEIRELSPADPSRKYVATPHRFRGKVPKGIVLRIRVQNEEIGKYEGIRVQCVMQSILSSQHIIMLDRLLDAVGIAEERGLFDEAQAKATIKELYKND